ncbi:hypothetical protein KUTeg_018242 [Tegillarca granosa]|uniref:Uncharacterized protein n=1 Tax=Tegillarca granosa TaxID=220873 RepID=A0ABQ9EH98_TEGGR|nr:hypothetical protein KUTeg_018242 [Tegillarca granosa]
MDQIRCILTDIIIKKHIRISEQFAKLCQYLTLVIKFILVISPHPNQDSCQLKSSKEVVKLRLLLDGSTIQALLDVDKEWQTKGKIRAFKARDDSKYAVVSDEDKTEALQALVELFNSMADTTSRIIVGAVGARRNLYLKDLSFVNHATEAKLLTMSTVGPNIFLGRYFDMLHTSAENIRDARETQHLRSQISSNSSETYSKKRSREQSPKGLKPSSMHHKSDKSEDARPWKQRYRFMIFPKLIIIRIC